MITLEKQTTMRLYFLPLFIFLFSLSIYGQSKSDNIIELPVEINEGYGPFKPIAARVNLGSREDEGNPWKNVYIKAKGVPEEWVYVRHGNIDIDIYQLVYQSFHSGKITPDFYNQITHIWDWTPDSDRLSKKPVKSTIAVVSGIDPTGQKVMIVDRNNNNDFSDDAVIVTDIVNIDEGLDDETVLKNMFSISYERLQDNKVVEKSANLSVFETNTGMYFFSFPQYGTATLDGYTIVFFGGFSSLGYKETYIALLRENNLDAKGKIWQAGEVLIDGEYIQVGSLVYQNKGYDSNKNVLRLKRMGTPANETPATQLGFKAVDFEAEELTTKKALSLERYKGKYLFLDFWAVWCVPCIKELPKLKALYDRADKSKVEIIGIVSESTIELVQKMRDEFGITYPTIYDNNENSITKNYNISSFPATFFIDPEGVIIAKNFKSEDLEYKLRELNLITE